MKRLMLTLSSLDLLGVACGGRVLDRGDGTSGGSGDGWPVLPQIDTLLAGSSADRTTRRRAFIVRTATLLAEALAAEVRAAPGAALDQAG